MKIQSFLIVSATFLSTILCNEAPNGERSLSRQKRLIYPQFTTYQISLCLVAQISSLPSHKVAINSGFQINYALPFKLSSFYNPMYWARSMSNATNPMLNFIERLATSESSDDDVDDEGEEEADDEDETTQNSLDDYEETTTMENNFMDRSRRDLSAGQFYSGLKETLSYSGYHDECLLKSVCELAAHPLHHDEDNIVNDVLHFILTPSLHQAFDDEAEALEKKLYEEAEEMGKSGADCEHLYGSNCKRSFLENVSRYVRVNDV